MADRPGSQVFRFVVVGGANTVLTYLLLWSLTYVVDAWVAYSVAFMTGVVLSAMVTGRLVFGSRPSATQRLTFGVWLCFVYVVGLASLQAGLALGVKTEAVLAAIPLLVTAPLNFFGGRRLLASTGGRRGGTMGR